MKVKGLFLDYDGTISPLNITRRESRIAGETSKTLFQIEQSIPVGIITTKDLDFIQPRTPFARAWCAIAGLETKIGERVIEEPAIRPKLTDIMKALEYARSVSDKYLLIEEKCNHKGQVVAFCLDWRHSSDTKESESRALKIKTYIQTLPLKVIGYEAQPFFDVYPLDIDKGKALTKLKRHFHLRDGVMYLGDSVVDNPALKIADAGIGVLHEESLTDLDGDYLLRFEDVSRFLQRLVESKLIFDASFPEIIRKRRD